MKKLYVGCAISGLPQAEKEKFLGMITELKDTLRGHFEVLDFLTATNTNGTPTEIYIRDIVECVEHADYMLAICDYPSTGLGYEMATAIEKRGIPVLAMAHRTSNVSKLIIGITAKNFHFIQYDSIDEVPEKTFEILLRDSRGS